MGPVVDLESNRYIYATNSAGSISVSILVFSRRGVHLASTPNGYFPAYQKHYGYAGASSLVGWLEPTKWQQLALVAEPPVDVIFRLGIHSGSLIVSLSGQFYLISSPYR